MPTLATLAGFEIPADRRIDGIDQTDLLLGKRDTGRDTFYYHGSGIRKGKWKYLQARPHFQGYAVEEDRQEVEELYDLEADVGERTNLAQTFPEKVRELRLLMRTVSTNEPERSRINPP